MSFFSRYNALVKKRPLATNILSTGFLFGLGDVLAQTIESQTEKDPTEKAELVASWYDPQRTARASLYGGLIFAPMADKWFKFVSRVNVVQGSKNINTLARVAMDQMGFAPFVGIPLYFSIMTWMESIMAHEGNIAVKIQTKLSTSYWDTLKSNWAVWPAVQLVNFAFVPVSMRLLVVNVVSIGWNCFLSLQMNTKEVMIID